MKNVECKLEKLRKYGLNFDLYDKFEGYRDEIEIFEKRFWEMREELEEAMRKKDMVKLILLERRSFGLLNEIGKSRVYVFLS
jgi:hypothetical protein